MPHYHLSLTTDQPVAIKTRISTRSISSDAAGSGVEMAQGDAMATVDELNAKVQLLEMQLENLEKHLEMLKGFWDQGTNHDLPIKVQGFWRKLGIRLRLFTRRQAHKPPERTDPGQIL